jgi:hypothetical protein
MLISDKTHYYISKSRNEANKIDIRSIKMKINNIVKLNLESRAKDLRAGGKSFADIAKVLSEENKVNITKDSVQRYFLSNEKAVAQVIERSDKLKMKVCEAEINTITKRVEIIDQFLEISEQALSFGDFRAAVMALRGATEAQDSLDERLGKLKAPTNTNINILNIQEAINGARERFLSAISSTITAEETADYFGQSN